MDDSESKFWGLDIRHKVFLYTSNKPKQYRDEEHKFWLSVIGRKAYCSNLVSAYQSVWMGFLGPRELLPRNVQIWEYWISSAPFNWPGLEQLDNWVECIINKMVNLTKLHVILLYLVQLICGTQTLRWTPITSQIFVLIVFSYNLLLIQSSHIFN